MSVRKINYTVNENTVSPETSQWGGIQYENNATSVSYVLEPALKEKLKTNYKLAKKSVYRIDFDSPVAGYQPSENIEPINEVITRDIPLMITMSGEPFQSTLVITLLDSEDNEVGTFYSKPARIYFDSVTREQYSEQDISENLSAMEESVSQMHSEVLESAASAESDAKVASDAMQKTLQAKLSLEGGAEIIFLGGDAQSQMSVEVAIDGSLSDTSNNAIQNKVISNALKNYALRDDVDNSIEAAMQRVVDLAVSEAVDEATSAAVEQAMIEAKLAAHPVGSYYFSADPTNPSEIFGGVWQQIKDKFILAAGDSYTAGDTGGAVEVTLTQEQLPNITGIIANVVAQAETGITCRGVFSPRAEGAGNKMLYGGGTQTTTTIDKTDEIAMSFGNNEAHNNMPPYVVAYCWQRIA